VLGIGPVSAAGVRGRWRGGEGGRGEGAACCCLCCSKGRIGGGAFVRAPLDEEEKKGERSDVEKGPR